MYRQETAVYQLQYLLQLMKNLHKNSVWTWIAIKIEFKHMTQFIHYFRNKIATFERLNIKIDCDVEKIQHSILLKY